jgi:glycosyltransferase involved in cell wall biosynthesis
VLFAAETLWREGLEFELSFIGGMAWGEELPARIAELQAAGRPIRVQRSVGQAILAKSYADAAFTVFASLHEGYGLPVAESLAAGTPVITADFGSTAEIAAGGGCVTVDPRDDLALTDAMRVLLTNPARLAELRAALARGESRSWDTYAAELWSILVEPEFAS